MRMFSFTSLYNSPLLWNQFCRGNMFVLYLRFFTALLLKMNFSGMLHIRFVYFELPVHACCPAVIHFLSVLAHRSSTECCERSGFYSSCDYLLGFHCRGPTWSWGNSTWDLWCTEWMLSVFFTAFVGIVLSAIISLVLRMGILQNRSFKRLKLFPLHELEKKVLIYVKSVHE
jgi:ABC-type phosphate/phosphonate transport system permease subunit